MAMLVGQRRGPCAEINITPMIDILLVLIISFLVIHPAGSHGLKALAPEESDEKGPAPDNTVVVTVMHEGMVRLNQEDPIAFSSLEERLHELFKSAADHVLFVRGEKDLDFESIAQVIARRVRPESRRSG